MKKYEDVILVGASNPEAVRMAHHPGMWERWRINVTGFIDNDPAKKGQFHGYPVFGTFEELSEERVNNSFFVNLITRTTGIRKDVCDNIQGWGGKFTNFIHPGTDLSDVALGNGIFIEEGVIVQARTVIGSHVAIHLGAMIAHEVKIGKYAFIAPGANILGLVEIGDGAMIGAGAIILPRLNIGPWARVGAGAVVTRSVPANTTVVGNPARPI